MMPKIDLHCHLDGSLAPELVRELLAEENVSYTEDELLRLLRVPEDCPSLAVYLERFALPIRCLQTRDHLSRAAYRLAMDAAAEHVVYLETRYAPSCSLEQGLTVQDTIEAVEEGFAKARREVLANGGFVETGIIVCAMRHLPMEENLRMLRAARELLGSGLCACDLAGDEAAFPMNQFTDLFEEARKLGLPFTIHAGECGSRENIRGAVELGASRIGHGIAMKGDPELEALLAARHIGVEVCPVSNLHTKASKSISDCPVREFLNAGIPVTVNTDNRTVSSTDSTRELALLDEAFALTEEELQQLYRNAVEIAFTDDDVKEQLLRLY